MQFDYYAASLPASISHCKSSLISLFPSSFLDEKPIRPFTQGLRHENGGFRLYWGGENPLPFFVSSGQAAVDGASFCRSAYPEHRVSRLDVAVDTIEAGGFDRITGIIEPIARAARCAVLFVGDPDPSQKRGRTVYFGSKSSDVRIVVYEKGLEQRAKGDLSASERWVRIELRVRPRKDRKALTASLTASEAWGLAGWSRRVADEVMGTVVPYLPDPSAHQATPQAAVAHMFRQYGHQLRKLRDLRGRDYIIALLDAALLDD
jgi:hypothetical protein